MTNILAFDSLHIVNPLRIIYLFFVQTILKKKLNSKNRLVLYRLDRDNIFIRDKRNLSGMPIGVHGSDIDELSIKFYYHLKKTRSCENIKIKNQQLYNLYTRQVKLKLEGLLRCAYRIKNLRHNNKAALEIISDRQSISIMKEALLFINFSSFNIKWKSNIFLTICISTNSILMRAAAILKMILTSTDLPKEYFYKFNNSEAPSILIAMTKRRPEEFYKSYVKKLDNKFNIFIYSVGFLASIPKGYQRLNIKRSYSFIHGLFSLEYLWFNTESYIADILIIFKNHSNLSISIDIVNSLYSHKIDALINKQQTTVLENFMAREARRRKIFIYADIMEEIFDCDFAICPSESEFTKSVKLALKDESKITFKGSNSKIKYRLSNFTINHNRYLHHLFNINVNKKIIFYASDPSKEQAQRYYIEKFLFEYFSNKLDYIFIVKTHSQDDGKVTNYAFVDAGLPSNCILIGDMKQKNKIVSKQFRLFNKFDFNSAMINCDGFITSTSSSILESLALGVKSGIVDLFSNGNYNYLINYNAVSLIDNSESLSHFLNNDRSIVTNEMLHYCGLKNKNEFNIESHLQKTLQEFYENS